MLKRSIAFAVLTLLLLPSFALADTLQGVISRKTFSGIDLTVYDAQGRAYPNGLHLKTDGKTRVSGTDSLHAGDFVQADVRQENDKSWRADSVTKLAMQNNNTVPRPSGVPQSNALMDALKSPQGQKLIKSGLSGA